MQVIFWILVTLLTVANANDQKKIVCYFSSWAIYRPGYGTFDISNIDPKLCTHLIYAYIGLNASNEVRVLDPWADLPDGNGRDGFNKFNKLRGQSPGTKTLIAVGGWNEDSGKFSKMVADPNARRTFVESTLSFVKRYGFDGLDFDWEYPSQRGGDPKDRANFLQLLKEMRAIFDREGLLLTAALAATEKSAKISYDIFKISQYLDFLNLMTYDYHGFWNGKTGINAPLYKGLWEKDSDTLLNVNASIAYWLSQGAPREKIVLGIPFYGRTFTLNSAKEKGIGAPANNPGNAGPYTHEPGTMGYNEICEMQMKEKWDIFYEYNQKVPYAVNLDQWIGYENTISIKTKAEYIKDHGLGGAVVWSIETDDFRGTCGNKYPLLNTLNEVLFEKLPDPSIPETTSSTSTTSKTPLPEVVCDHPGYIRDPYDCSSFFMCVPTMDHKFVQYKFTCSSGLVFNTKTKACDWPINVDCSSNLIYDSEH